VNLPVRERPQFFGFLHGIKEGEHLPQFVHCIGRNAFSVVVLIQAFQALVCEASNFHRQTVACSLTLVKRNQRNVIAFFIAERAGAGVPFAC
jgi:hypothetical protein